MAFINWDINIPEVLGGRSQASKDQEESFILDNLKQMAHLDNTSWWQEQMTKEEWEMKRHPNRGHSWIPQRLRIVRQKLWHTWYSIRYVDGKDIVMTDVPDGSTWPHEEHKSCIRCNRTKDEYIRDSISDDLKRNDGVQHWHTWHYGWCRFCSKEVKKEMLTHLTKIVSMY